MSEWNLGNRLAAAGVVVAILAIGAAFIAPEIRGRLGLEPTDEIVGLWDEEKAKGISMALVEHANWKDLSTTCAERKKWSMEACEFDHEFFHDFSLLYPNAESKILVFSSITEGAECHSCAPDLSLFQFDKTTRGWRLAHVDLAVENWGQWGQLGEGISLKVIGNNTYGLVFERFEEHQGWIETSASIFGRVGDSFSCLLVIRTLADNAKAGDKLRTSWDATWEPISRGASMPGFFDIKVVRRGIDEGRNVRETTVWQFTGNKYEMREPRP